MSSEYSSSNVSGSGAFSRRLWGLGVVLLTALLAFQLARPAAMLWNDTLAPLFADDWVSAG